MHGDPVRFRWALILHIAEALVLFPLAPKPWRLGLMSARLQD